MTIKNLFCSVLFSYLPNKQFQDINSLPLIEGFYSWLDTWLCYANISPCGALACPTHHPNNGANWNYSQNIVRYNVTELQIRGGFEDNSKIIFLISQQKYVL